MKTLLSVENLNIQIGQKSILKDVSMAIKPKEIVSIVGESGSGKTTLMKAMLGLLPHQSQITSGKLCYEGIEKPFSKAFQLRGSEIAYIYQNPGNFLNPIMKIRNQMVRFIKRHCKEDSSEIEFKLVALLEKMQFKDPLKVLEAYPHELSGGMKQRVAIAMAMSVKPKLILADEPTSALDVITQHEILKEIVHLRELYGTSFVIITHNLGSAAHLSDQVVVMKEGRLVETGQAQILFTNPKHVYTQSLIEAMPKIER